ncbi:MAG: hypothetical protein RL196_287 [Actinomycetota bacterium]|jgi:serine/threonine-protein kinase HipA
MVEPVAHIYKQGELAAVFSKENGKVRFDYLSDYVTLGKPAIASTLPLTSEPIILANGATPAFFAGLLPEGPRLQAMRSRIKTSLNDDVGLLLEIGADLIGDVQVLPPDADPKIPREALKLPSKSEDLDFAQTRQDVFGSRASGLPGVQDKVSSRMLSAPAKTAGIDYMLKLNPTAAPFAVENEHHFLTLANRCGLETADFDLLTDKHGEHALRLKRFDRIYRHPNSIALAAEDGCQALGEYPSEKYNVDALTVANRLIEMCPSKAAAAINIFRQLVFNWLIGNGDAHAKNFSVLKTETGEWRVSPAYDLLCTRFYDDRNMALPLAGKNDGWSRLSLIEAAEQFGLNAVMANKVIDKQLSVLADLPEQILNGALPFARHLNIDVSGFLRKRAKALA